jgi:hypothetical protein
MNWVNLVSNQYYFGEQKPPGPDWQQVTTEEFNALRASGWDPTEYVFPYRVSKDTIVSRIVAAQKLDDLITLTNGLPEDQAYLWNNFAWFWSTNPTIVGMCQQLGLDPAVILAPDPYLT